MTKPQEKKYTWAIKLFINIHIISALVKVLHWPYYEPIALLSVIILLVFYPFRYNAKNDKQLLDHVKMAWVLVHCFGLLAFQEDMFALRLVETLLFFFWFINEGFFYFDINLAFWKEKDIDTGLLDVQQIEPKFSNLVYLVDYLLLLSILLVIAGALFLITHWSFSLELLIAGYGLFAISIWFKNF